MVQQHQVRGLAAKKRRDKARSYVNGHLRFHPCTMCGNDDIRVLQFHHRNPQEKRYTISEMVSRGMRPSLIAEEVKKTVVLCSNCHIIFHFEERHHRDQVKGMRGGR